MSDWGTRPVAATSVNHTRVCARRRRLVQWPSSLIRSLFTLRPSNLTFGPKVKAMNLGVVCNNSRMQEFRTHNVI